MLKKEILGILKSRKSMIVTAIFILIPIVDLIIGVIQRGYVGLITGELSRDALIQYNQLIHPTFAAFLSGTTKGHIPQMAYVWLMPMLILMLYSDGYVVEKSRGYTNIMLMRVSRVKYYLTKYVVAFMIPALIVLFSIILNFAIAYVIFRGGTSFLSMELLKDYDETYNFMFTHPYITYFKAAALCTITAGICGIITQSVAFIAEKYKVVYLVTAAIWIIFISCKYSVTYITQPFIESEFANYSAIVVLILIAIGVVSVGGTVYKLRVRSDEL